MRQKESKPDRVTLALTMWAYGYNCHDSKVRNVAEKWLDAKVPAWRKQFDSSQGITMILYANSSLYLQVMTAAV